ncbi:lipid A deacylase LpxR family protein [Verrucomicrobiota bacterium]
MKRFKCWLAISIFWLAISYQPARADKVSLYIENDVLEEEDGYYTQGTQIKYERDDHWGLKVGQLIYTPSSKSVSEPQYGDRPYAGWLYLNSYKDVYKKNYVNHYELGVGIVGDYSYADKAQIQVHKWLDNMAPKGWRYQLLTEPTIQAACFRTYSFPLYHWMELRPSAGINVGNAIINAEFGACIRMGYNLTKEFDPIIETYRLAGGQEKFTHAYMFIGVNGKAFARNLFLDGNTFRKGDDVWTVDKEYFVADGIVGVCVGIYQFELTFTHIERTQEFKTQPRDNRFDSLQLTYKY